MPVKMHTNHQLSLPSVRSTSPILVIGSLMSQISPSRLDSEIWATYMLFRAIYHLRGLPAPVHSSTSKLWSWIEKQASQKERSTKRIPNVT